MKFRVKDGGGDFEPCPEGLHRGVLADIIDLGIQDTKFGKKYQLRFVWEMEPEDKDGRRFQIRQTYNCKTEREGDEVVVDIHPKSKLYQHISSWRGSKVDVGAEIRDKSLIGSNCQIQVIHNKSESTGRTYGNIQAIVPAVKGAEPLTIRDYKRSEKEADYGNGEDLPF